MDFVKNYYSEIQFNTPQENTAPEELPLPILETLLDTKDIFNVLELGCGNGWLSNRIAQNYPSLTVTGIDIVSENVSYAKQTSNKIFPADFFEEDIMTTDRTADLTVSIGALHHMPEFTMEQSISKAFDCANRFSFIGLYHKESRDTMLEWFNQFPTHTWYDIFTGMTQYIKDEKQRESWFKDQFYNPFEQSVTLEQVKDICAEKNVQLITSNISTDSTSDNVRKKLNKKSFTSGFIYFLIDKTETYLEHLRDERLLKERVNQIREEDPFIYR